MDPQDALRILEEERARGMALIAEAGSSESLEAAKVVVLGRKSRFTEVQRSLGSLEENVRRNMEMFERAFSMFVAPFARRGEPGDADAPQRGNSEIDQLKSQLAEMQKQLNRLAKDDKND